MGYASAERVRQGEVGGFRHRTKTQSCGIESPLLVLVDSSFAQINVKNPPLIWSSEGSFQSGRAFTCIHI